MPHHRPNAGTLWKEVDVAATSGNDNRLSEELSQQNGGQSIGINIVCINQIKISSPQPFPHLRETTHEHRHGMRDHSNLWKYEVPRMVHAKPGKGLRARDSRHVGPSSVHINRRRVWDRCDDSHFCKWNKVSHPLQDKMS